MIGLAQIKKLFLFKLASKKKPPDSLNQSLLDCIKNLSMFIPIKQSNFPLHSQLMETIEELKILKFLKGNLRLLRLRGVNQ